MVVCYNAIQIHAIHYGCNRQENTHNIIMCTSYTVIGPTYVNKIRRKPFLVSHGNVKKYLCVLSSRNTSHIQCINVKKTMLADTWYARWKACLENDSIISPANVEFLFVIHARNHIVTDEGILMKAMKFISEQLLYGAKRRARCTSSFRHQSSLIFIHIERTRVKSLPLYTFNCVFVDCLCLYFTGWFGRFDWLVCRFCENVQTAKS